MTTTGSKYTGYQDAALIAKAIRADIKQAQKDGLIPTDVKISVRCEKYSMGQSVNARITGWTADQVWSWTADGYRALTPAAKAIKDRVEQIREDYNRNNSDPMTDYYEVTYYGTTDWDRS
jgi:hypothetical protein